MNMIMEVDNLAIEEWNADLNEEIISKNDPSSAAIEILGSISEKLGVKNILPLLVNMIKECVSNNDWKY